MPHTASVLSMNQPGYRTSYQQHQQQQQQQSSRKPRPPSIAASSIVTIQPAPSHTATGQILEPATYIRNPDPYLHFDDYHLGIQVPKSRLSRSASPRIPQPLPESHVESQSESQISDGVGNLNRWSQSTASSAGNLDSPGRRRTSSGANPPFMWNQRKPSASNISNSYAEELSPRSLAKPQPRPLSPMKSSDQEQHRRNAPSLDKPLPPAIDSLSSLHIPTTSVVSPTESDVILTANSFTPSSVGLLTPSSYPAADYFGAGATAGGASKRDRLSTSRPNNPTSSAGISQTSTSHSPHQYHPNSSFEDLSSTENSRSKPRERREKDKKTMLSKALEKANTAVLLDNAMNYEGALEAYQDACRLLEFVMDRTSGLEDKRKLEAIRETYAIRIEELVQLFTVMKPASEQKSLPPRPMSNGSLDLSPTQTLESAMVDYRDSTMTDNRDSIMTDNRDSISTGNRYSAVIGTATLTRIVDAPRRPNYAPRNSFLTDAIQEVEASSSEAFLGPLWERSKSPFRLSFTDRTARQRDNLEETYMPPPLTPRRSPSHDAREEHGDEADSMALSGAESPVEREMVNPTEAGSWLDTIDESDSDASSMHSRSHGHQLHRRDLSAPVVDTELDFDVAFDAAVEAAYEEGYLPDHDARPSTMERARIMAEDQAPIEGFGYPSDDELDIDDEAEEERILDDITRDYVDHGFDFGVQSKSALPRESDSSALSRDTWQSSIVSNRTTAESSLSAAIDKSVEAEPKVDNILPPSAMDTTQSMVLLDLIEHSARPLSVISEGARSVQDRRSTKHLKIETARKPLDMYQKTPLPAVSDEQTQDNVEGGQAEQAESDAANAHPFSAKITSPVAIQASAGSLTVERSSAPSPLPPDGAEISGAKSPRPRLFRKNKSTLSLRDNNMLISEEPGEQQATTPLSASFMTESGLHTSRRPFITPSAGSYPTLRDGQFATAQLFDTSLGNGLSQPSSPRSEDSMGPPPLEPCPESALLRPFWLLRCIASTITHPRGGFLTTRLFVPREVWQTRNVRLKYIDEKIAHCDLLAAALGKLSGVDTYDADAVLDELQAFEEIMERVQTMMIKKLGSEVGVQSVNTLFKDATTTTERSSVTAEGGRDGPKTNSGKSYLSSWRKLRSKNSGMATPGGSFSTGMRSEKDSVTMASVPMTSFVQVDKRPTYTSDSSHDPTGLEGPLKDYMNSLARLVEATQILDQIARQVEDPGLKHSSPTHIGLELSTRHAAEFFGFYVCRFVLADLGILLDKFVKRSTEWVMA